MSTKQYTDINWVKNQILSGNNIHVIARLCNISIFTTSRYYTKAVNTITVEEAVELSKIVRDIKVIISPKTQLYRNIVDATNFLQPKSSIRERLWFIANNTNLPPTCKMCNHLVRWDTDNQSFRTFCSSTCQSTDPDVITKREETNMMRRGVKYWNQRHIPGPSLIMLQDKDWLNNEHVVNKKPLMQIGKELNVHPLLPAQYLSKYGLPAQRFFNASNDLVDYVKTIYDGTVVVNTRQVIKPLELDIFLPDANIAIEYNGLYWHSDLYGIDKRYHINKTIMCNKLDIRLIHVLENEWIDNQQLVKSRLAHILGNQSHRLYARMCKTVEISHETATLFLQENHIQGACNAKFIYGLMHEDELVSVMTFGIPRFNKKYEFELIRFAHKKNTTVVGGANKLFARFIKDHQPNTVITYSDKRWNHGGVYANMGFKFSHTSSPNYWYFKKNTHVLISRVSFQKHKMHKLLNEFNPARTEWENMADNGYNRIWDCGNDVWTWQK